MRRRRLRTRVLVLTSMFTVALFAITFGLTWRAKVAQQRWTELIAIETKAVSTLDEVIRAQNAFHARYVGGADAPHRYLVVSQLLGGIPLQPAEVQPLRDRVGRFRTTIAEPQSSQEEIELASDAVVTEARNLAAQRRRVIARQLPALERESRAMMSTGLAAAWILALLGFAAVQITLRKVVRPLEELANSADRIAAGDLTARAPVAGDHEIAALGVAFNRMTDELKSHARTDELTRLPNFRAFCERLEAELDRADRYPETFGVLVLDLDRFKKYNDTYGHASGNEALRRVATAIRQSVRSVDYPARYGGEEFAVIAPQADRAALATIAERIRASVEALPAPEDGAAVTVSIGAALFPQEGRSREALFQVADERLYQAKKRGRNRVVSGEGDDRKKPARVRATS